MTNKQKKLADGVIHPYPPTMKSRPKWKYVDEKLEAFRLWKVLKSNKFPNFKDDLTDHGKHLMMKYYGIKFR